ncbi:MAG: zraS 5 [Gemmataceae bacterium]|nr:zraS 5 [Gemmataceae bacterium]
MALNRQMVFQVTMPALLVALAMFGISLLGIRSINHLQADRDKIVSEHAFRLQKVQDLETYMRHIRLHSFLYVMSMTPERWAKVERDQTNFETTLGQLRDTTTDDGERRAIEAIETGYLEYRRELQDSTRSPPGPDRAAYLKWSDTHPIRHVVVPCDELLGLNRQAMKDTADESAREGDRTSTGMILLGVLGAGGGLIGGFGVAWGLSRSITRLNVQLQDVHAHLNHEVASLRLTAEGGNLQTMERQLGTILTRVREVVGQLQRQECETLRAEQLAAVGQLAASIAHEVRNPLTSINLLVGAALTGRYPNGLTETDLRVIHDEVGRVERKVQALLDFARPPEGEHHAEDVAGIVHRVVGLVQERLRQQAVRLSLELPTEPVTAELDRDQFQGVLVNLIFNALDAMPGGGRLDVRLAREGAGNLRLSVADSGPGIDTTVADRLFTPFTSTKTTGTGLGLSVSHRVVRAHGGDLTAANRDGGGACFTITLPAACGDPSRADVACGG